MQTYAIFLAFLLLTIKTPLLWFLYIFVLPGYCILSLTNLKTKEKILFSLPFSILGVTWPYFLITRLTIPIPAYYFTAMPLIFLCIYIAKKKPYQNLQKLSLKFNSKIKIETLYTLILSAILFFSFYYSFQAFVSPTPNTGAPLTLGAKYIAETQILKENIHAGIGAIGWSDNWFSGMHTFTSYSPISYLILAIGSLNYEVWQMHNLYVYLFSFIFAIYLYSLLRHLNVNKYTSLTISIITATLPPFIQVNNVLKSSIDLALTPLALYSLLLILNKPTKTNTILFTATMTVWAMNYYLTIFMILYQLAIFTLFYILKSKEKILILANIVKAGTLSLLIGSIWLIPFLHGSITKTFSMMRYIEGGWFQPLKNTGEIISYMTSPISAKNIPFDLHSFTTFSPQFFYIGLISSIIILLLSLKTKNKNYLLAILPITHMAFIFIQLTPIREILPFYYAVYGQIYLYFPLLTFFAITTALLIEYLSNHIKYTKVITTTLLIILFIPVFQYSHNLGSFLRESSVTNENNIAWLYKPMEQIGKGGSFVIFGLYGPGYIPAITQYANIQAFSGYGVESHMLLQPYEKRIVPFQEASMDNLLTDNPVYAYNIFKQSNVRVLVSQRCSNTNTGQTVINPNSVGEKAYQTLTKDPRFKIISNESCIALLTTTNPKKAEKIYITEVLVDNPTQDNSENIKRGATHKDLNKFLNNREKAITALLQVPAAEHIHFTAKEFAYPKNRYTNIIINRTSRQEEIEEYLKNNSTVIYFKENIKIDNPNFHSYKSYPKTATELNEILKKARYLDTPVNFKQDKTNYELNEKGLILLKETYFRKWHSNADLKESYLGFILIDSTGTTKLWFGPTILDYLAGLFTLAGLIITLIIITNQTQPDNTKKTTDKNEKKETTKKRKKRKKKR